MGDTCVSKLGRSHNAVLLHHCVAICLHHECHVAISCLKILPSY